ncbi:hypothetical protein J6590_033643 [Homalodisca vitripennis]|nr:hypothetical protein J6590_033643 [Homalodisca vitripennis]
MTRQVSLGGAEADRACEGQLLLGCNGGTDVTSRNSAPGLKTLGFSLPCTVYPFFFSAVAVFLQFGPKCRRMKLTLNRPVASADG